MTPRELQELIDAKEFTKIATNLYKLTKKLILLKRLKKYYLFMTKFQSFQTGMKKKVAIMDFLPQDFILQYS